MSLGARPTTLPERPTGQVFSEDILRTHHSHEKYPLLQHRSAAAPLVPIAPPRMRDRDYREHYNPYPHGRARSPNRPPSPRQYHDPPTSSSAPDYDPRRRLSYNSRVPQSDSWRPLREPPTNRVTSQPLRRDTREGNSSSTRSWNPDRSFQPSASWSRNRDDYSPPPRSPVVPRKPVDFHASGPSLSYMQHDDYPPVGDSEAESYSPPPRPPRPLVRKPPEFLFSGPSRSYIAHEHYPPPGRDSGSYPDRPDFRSADNVYSRRNPRPTNRPSALGDLYSSF
ncbi:hypothetical protein SISSUDRAFT_857340 [Sistotremastrum suecicum HHB10207 ss-3]|uniref:Uncharacterized protein n=1 Tax=Sistotremastrum suecicum HHB10207 ss-3 TaxID=1314776 RepID=A0A166CHZ1_9AGAM|nr:hypothetical protein SISSUDRAFT_857340 [Sistotremastrum suecicum HHB10207 ss-3]